MTITTDTIARLRDAAEKATPGPWRLHAIDDTSIVAEDNTEIGTTCDSIQAEREDSYNIAYERMEADAAYIAAANPATLLALLDALEAVRAEVERQSRRISEQAAQMLKLNSELATANRKVKHEIANRNRAEAKVAPLKAEYDRLVGVAIGQTQDIAKLREALADAIRRPMGVVPESAEGLVNTGDLAAAEDRRAARARAALEGRAR